MSVRKREEEKKDEEMKLLAYVNKTMNIKTKRNVAEKDRKSMIIATRPEKDHHERLTEVKQKHKDERRQQVRKIENGMSKRQDQVDRNLGYLKEENEKRKEVKNLHKIDQQENLQRKQFFEKLGLQNQAQMILEKKFRVPKNAN